METKDFTTQDGRGQLQKLRRLLVRAINASANHESKTSWLTSLFNNTSSHVNNGNPGATLPLPTNNNSDNAIPYLINALRKAVSEASIYQGDYLTQMLQDLTDSLLELGETPQQPATLWVNAATGDDSHTYAEVQASNGTLQWATLGRAVWGSSSHTTPVAAQAAQAGDVVSIAAGTYDYAGALGTDLVTNLYNPENSGTAQDRIEFVAEGVVNITHSGTGDLKSVIGAAWDGLATPSYITWRGQFTIDSSGFTWLGDRAPVTFFGDVGNEAVGCIVDGVVLNGHDRSDATNNNWSGVRFEHANFCHVRNSAISGFRRDGHGWAFIAYDSVSCTINNNRIIGAAGSGGIYLKGAQNGILCSDFSVFKNHISDCESGMATYYAAGADIYQNLIEDCDFGFDIATHNENVGNHGFGPENIMFINNTIYNSRRSWITWRNGYTGALWSGVEYFGCVFANNIGHTVSGATGGEGTGLQNLDGEIAESELRDTASLLFKHNLWFGENAATFVTYGDQDLVANIDYATWLTYGQDSHAQPTLRVDPQFTLAGTTYTLAGGSPALNAGLDVLDLLGAGTSGSINMGCYILPNQSDVIGIAA